MTNLCVWFNVALRPQKPQGSLGWGAQDGHFDFHTAPELCEAQWLLARVDNSADELHLNCKHDHVFIEASVM